MWAEAMSKLEGMDSTERERLWPQLVQGFKDLSQRLKVDFITCQVSMLFVWWFSAFTICEKLGSWDA